MKQYFAADIDRQVVQNEEGDAFSAEQFKKIIERNAAKHKFFDMTIMTQRFVALGYNWDELERHYNDLP